MQKIIRIARLEMSILFYSPIAWLVLIIFIIQGGISFTEQLYNQETTQQLERPLVVVTRVLFTGDNGVFKTIQENLYLYIPLLTMGLLSRETSSGSIKLLLSSPVTVREIVLGKFLAVMTYGLLMIFVLLCFVFAGYVSVASLDVRFLLGGIFGLYLLLCAYAAIGLFMSSLTSYQVVAAISTLAVLAGLNFIGEIGQGNDFIRELTYWLSMAGRTDKMVDGLITSKDVVYFILIMFFFIILTIIKLNSGRQTVNAGVKLLRYMALAVGLMILGYLTSLPSLTAYFDTTRFKDRTLTKESQKLVKRLNKPISMVSYTNVIDRNAGFGAPQNRMADQGQFSQYQRFLPELKMEYISYYDTLTYYNDKKTPLTEQAKRASEALGFNFNQLLTPKQIHQKINLLPEENSFVRMVSYDGKQTPLRMFNDMLVYPKEAEINAALKRLLDGPAKVGMLMGNDERSADNRSDSGYQLITRGLSIRGALINQGFDVVDIDINQSAILPEGLAVLVIADPTIPFSGVQLQKIDDYIQHGGNLLIAGEPGRQAILNPLLSRFKVSIMEGTLLEESENDELNLVKGVFTPMAKEYKMSFYDNAIVSLPGAAGLIYQNTGIYKKEPLLLSNQSRGWNKLGLFDLKNKIVFDQYKEQKKAYPLALAVTRDLGGRQQRIMVVGDADFMSNSELQRNTPTTVNPSWVIKMFRWFSNGTYPVSISRPASIDTVILVTRSQINFQKILFLGAIPLLIGVCGGIVLVRRKRK